MRMLDLFSGIGGISLAAEWAGIETVAFCEIEPYCQNVLRKHWPNTPIFDDVRKISKDSLIEKGVIDDARTIDLICGGYPCQPFSVAGKREGENDDRHLWPEMSRLIKEIRPTWVLGENVAGHISLGLDNVLSDLESAGYETRAFVLPACAVKTPHRRDRVWIVGYTERSGCGREPRRRSGKEPENGHSKLEEGAMADSHWTRSKEFLSTKRQHRERQHTRKACGTRCDRTTQSGMGGVLAGISYWLDRYPWPALMGQEQHDWEPSRVATGVKDRLLRLKALGNAVVPVQVLPILQAIKSVHDGI